MKKFLKVFAVVVSILILLIIVLVVLANVLITPERVKSTLVPLVEENLGRKIDLGVIEVSLLSGIEIRGLKVYEQDGQEVFVATDLVRLKYQLLPLLAMKVVIDEVRLQKPSIRVVRFNDKTFNFSDLLTTPEDKPASGTKNKQESLPDVQGGAPISLLVSNVLIEEGQLVFLDHVLNDAAPYRYEISALQIVSKGVSLTGKIPLSVQCQLNGSSLDLDGYLNLQPVEAVFDVNLQDLDVVAFNPYFADSLPGKLGGLKLNLKSKVSGNPDKVAVQGTLSLADLDLQLDALPDAPLQKASLNVDFDLAFAQRQELLQILQLGIDYNGIKVVTQGDLSNLSTTPLLKLKVSVPKLQIRQAVSALPPGLVGEIGGLDPAGAISVEADLAGATADLAGLLKSAKIEMEEVEATVGDYRPAFSGRLQLAGQELVSDGLQLRIGDNRADINLRANHLFSAPILVEADVTSERFLLDPLLMGGAGSVAGAGKGGVDQQPITPPEQTELGPFDLPLKAKGTINISQALWNGLEIKNFLARYELSNNIFTLSRMDGEVAGGTFSNSARVDLGRKGLAYSAKLGLKSIQASPLLKAFAPKADGSLIGALNLVFALEGRGTVWQAISRNLTGSGDLLLTDGRVLRPDLVNGLSSFLQLPELNDIQFDNFSSQFKIVDGKVKIDGQMLGSTLKLFPKGTVGLDGALNLGLDTRLSPELSAKLDKKGSVAGYLADNEGWTSVPLLLKGDLSSPRFSLDPKGVQEQASKVIGKELDRQLEKLFNRSGSAPQSQGEVQPGAETTPKQDPTKKLLEDSLQKLFGN